MQLSIKIVLILLGLAVLLLGFAVSRAEAQSLSPMHNQGTTPTDIKGFRLTVGNPYAQRMSFRLIPMDPDFELEVPEVSVSPSELVMAPGIKRQVILAFRIPASHKERTIGLCVVPTNISGPILPRVCGTYTGVML